jgi:hypothetical protein
MRKLILAAAIGLGLSGPTRAASECRDAVDSYNSALDDISSYLRSYSRCVSGSRGHDDCSTEFRHLKSAQDDFEEAVSRIESECE